MSVEMRRHFFIFNASYHSYELPGPADTDDIVKVIGSKVKVTDIFRKKHFSGGM